MDIKYKGIDIKTGEPITSKSKIQDIYGNVHLLEEISNGFNWDICHSIFPESLEVSFNNGESFLKLRDFEIHTCTDFDLKYSDMKRRDKKVTQPPNGNIFTIITDKGR